ncbi:hypothetical protein HWV62_20244 [Athelia sp. TMB]|nr:hypothetical protein HWV62_20244 [Athelia sp. TMB]
MVAAPFSPLGTLADFEHRDLTPHIGTRFPATQLSALLRAPNAQELITDLAALVAHRGVVFFAAQDLSLAEQTRLADRLGAYAGRPPTSGLHRHPISEETSEISAEVSVIDSKGGIARADLVQHARASRGWHADITFERIPSDYALLKMHTLPDVGGDTLWASGYEAYDRLSPAFARFLEGLTAVHTAPFFVEYAKRTGIPIQDPRGAPENTGSELTAVHPVIRTHPGTGFKTLFVNRTFTTRIVELSPDESDTVLDYLFRHISENHDLQVRPFPLFPLPLLPLPFPPPPSPSPSPSPSRSLLLTLWSGQVRYTWGQDDLAIWDNRCTFHTATNDYPAAAHRQGNRVVSLGERPFFDPASRSRRAALELAA